MVSQQFMAREVSEVKAHLHDALKNTAVQLLGVLVFHSMQGTIIVMVSYCSHLKGTDIHMQLLCFLKASCKYSFINKE